jgi:hypothetical protein
VYIVLISLVLVLPSQQYRHGEFNFLISQDAWLAGQGIVISAYSLRGSIPSKHHVVPLSSADADSGADYTDMHIFVPELDHLRLSACGSTPSSSVGRGDLSPCDADDAAKASSDDAAVSEQADVTLQDDMHAAADGHLQQQHSDSISSSSNDADDDLCEWRNTSSYSVTAMKQAVLHSVTASCNSIKYSVHHLWTRACAAASSTVASVQSRFAKQLKLARLSVQTAATGLQRAVQQQLHGIKTAVFNRIRTYSSVQQCVLASICSIVQRVHKVEICSTCSQLSHQFSTSDISTTASVLFISTALVLIGMLLAAKRSKARRTAAAVVSTTVTVHQSAADNTEQQQQQQHRKRVHTTHATSRSSDSSSGRSLNSVMMMLDDELAGTALVACDSRDQRAHGTSSSSNSTRANRHPFS